MNKYFAIDPNQQYKVFPPEVMELPEEERPYFMIQPLTASAAASLEDNLAETSLKKGEDNTMRLKSGTSILNALKKGLKGWGNFYISEGNEAPWRDNNGTPRPENFDYIPTPWRRWLAERITEGKGLSEQEAKNSD